MTQRLTSTQRKGVRNGGLQIRRDEVAILVADGFEQVELIQPRKALEKVGAETKVVSPAKKKVRGWDFTWGKKISVDLPLDEARADDFEALLLPGGVMNPDTLRVIPAAVAS